MLLSHYSSLTAYHPFPEICSAHRRLSSVAIISRHLSCLPEADGPDDSEGNGHSLSVGYAVETRDIDTRIHHLLQNAGQPSSCKARRQHIEPLFGFVDFDRIAVDIDKPWFTRERKYNIDSRSGGGTADIELLAENVSKEGIIEPLHVLYEEAVDPTLWNNKTKLALEVPHWKSFTLALNKTKLALEVPHWKSFTLALGFRRYDAIKKAMERGLLKKALKVPVRIYLPEEIVEKTGDTVEHFLTKAAVSSNVFFKGYTSIALIGSNPGPLTRSVPSA